ncbi:HugZ family protein [Pleomorphomonas sp. NRK KF1]|uniref:HugZ family pyridoxamine 5'-phosphate oxidase n=1 Tax=Pleomorphomonas sp. NRK KF1 TaxID=2943000 RepID=UPI002044C488|nr:CREG family protein [Pleomorphomonas sp. NRK KF1]MCM5553061.1 CREG family protein [Pleomorphomonas sp. NRK KF1]
MDDSRFDARDMTRRIVRSAATASLGTLTPDGGPFVTFVTVATDFDGSPLLLLSSLAAHARHLERDNRASLLMQVPADGDEDPLAGARVTIVGRLTCIARDQDDHDRLFWRFVDRHPEAEGYAEFTDFSIYRMAMEGIHLVAGFGRIARLGASDFLVPPALAEAFAEAEAALLKNFSSAGARLVAVDPDGADLLDGGVTRLHFSRRAEHPGEVRDLLLGPD